MRGTLKLGRVAGIPVGVHWSLLAIGALLAYELQSQQLKPEYPGYVNGAYWLAALATVGAFFASVLVHELAHAVAARRHGMVVNRIELWMLGGMTHLEGEASTPRADGIIAAAGPAATLLCAALFGALTLLARAADVVGMATSALAWLAVINLLLAAFNLLPATPLDGGRILRAVLWQRSGDPERAAISVAKVGRVVATGVIGVGLWLAVTGEPAIFTVLVGWFMLSNARASQQLHVVRAALVGRPVREVTWFGVARAPDWTTVGDMLDQHARMGPVGVVAVERFSGDLRGLVTLSQLLSVPEQQRYDVRLAELAIPFERLGRAAPTDDTMAALAASPGPIMAVWEREQLVGVVTPALIRRQAGG